MMYENLLVEADSESVDVYEKKLSPLIKGLYSDSTIWINNELSSVEKGCILAEELGHYHTSCGDILDQKNIQNRKQENRARNWAYKRLIPLRNIVTAHKFGIRNRYELAQYLNVTEEFLQEALTRYQEEYGIYTTIDGFTLYFDPLGVLEMFSDYIIID